MKGTELRDRGMRQAKRHAEDTTPGWGDQAYQFLIANTAPGQEFMTEEVRKASEGTVPEPPHTRAWGSVVTRAVRAGVIKRVGYRAVENPAAHATPATVWERV